MTSYSLTFVNDSANTATACVYQRTSVGGMASVAWLTQACAPSTQSLFTWTPTYQFVWGQAKSLVAGDVVFTSQWVAADPNGQNKVTFTCSGGAYSLTSPTQGAAGFLVISEDATVTGGQAAVGLGMSNLAALLAEAQPNWTLNLRADVTYWIVFGDYEAGQVLDLDAIPVQPENPSPAAVAGTSATIEVSFGASDSITATLGSDNTWTLSPGS